MRTTVSRLAMLFLLFTLPTLARAADLVPWVGTLKEAQLRAGQEKRLVLIHFYGDACPPCKVVERDIFSRQDFAQGVASQYIPVKVNAEKETAIAKQFGVSKWPTDVIITPSGTQLHKMVSPQNYAVYATELNRVAVEAGLKPSAIAAAAKGSRPVDHYAASDPYSSVARPAVPSASPLVDRNGSDRGTDRFADRYNDRSPSQPRDRYASVESPEPPRTTRQDSEPRGRSQYDEPLAERRPVAAPSRDRYAEAAPPASKRYDDYTDTLPPRRAESARDQRDPAPQITRPADRMAERSSEKIPSRDDDIEPHVVRPAESRGDSPPVRQVSQVTPKSQETTGGNPPLGLDGYCPVTFYEQFVILKKDKAWKKGDPRYGAIHRGRLYLFAGEREQKEFLASMDTPDKYSPSLSGYDPVIFAREGKLVSGSRALGREFRKQVYLFASEENLNEFVRNPVTYLNVVREAMNNADIDVKRR